MQRENGDEPGGPREKPADRDRAAAESDQTLSDEDQTAADADQSASDANRSQSESDQRASDRDQAASDRELDVDTSGGDELERTHAVSRADREQSTLERDRASFSRFQVAADRDDQAERRDRNSAGRDLAAESRDRAAEQMDKLAEAAAPDGEPGDPRLRDALAAAERARAGAALNRERAAEDRERAAGDRRQAAEDRKQANLELERAHLDSLTGAYQRGIGEVALGHELARAQREDEHLVLAFVDVDGLKGINDREGHPAGDEVLREVSAAIQAKLRSYDPLVRVGGDEFVCAIADANLESATSRFAEIRALLKTASISVGISEMRPDDSLTDLIERSNADMRRARAASRVQVEAIEGLSR